MNHHSATWPAYPAPEFCAMCCLGSLVVRRRAWFVQRCGVRAFARIDVKRSAPQTKLLGRKRNLDAGFAKEFVDAVIDVAADLRVHARAIGPDHQTEVHRKVAELQELNLWRRIVQHVFY